MSFEVGSQITGIDGTYVIRITDLADGTYTLKATAKKAVEDNMTFTVETHVTLTVLANATTTYCTLADGVNESTCASAAGKVRILKVNSITPCYIATDNININIKGK